MVLISSSELRNLLRSEINTALSQQLAGIHDQKNDELLKRSDVANMFGVSLVTVHAWINSGQLPSHRIGSRVFFKKLEVIEAMRHVKIRKKT